MMSVTQLLMFMCSCLLPKNTKC